jgi:transcriptional regulator NrdR family protein
MRYLKIVGIDKGVKIMNCPKCDVNNDYVYDSHESTDTKTCERKRKCMACGHKFKTIEKIVSTNRKSWKESGIIHKDKKGEEK